jgi:hypothetical protein
LNFETIIKTKFIKISTILKSLSLMNQSLNSSILDKN